MEHFEHYRSKVKETYDQIKDFDSEKAKEYLEKEQQKDEYKEARDEKIKAHQSETRENLQELKEELEIAIKKYYDNGLFSYLEKFLRTHGPQNSISLDDVSQRKVNILAAKSIAKLFRENESEEALYLLTLLKNTGVFGEDDIEESIKGALSTLSFRDRDHGESNLETENAEEKMEIVRERIQALFESK